MIIRKCCLTIIFLCSSFSLVQAQLSNGESDMLPELYQDDGDDFIVITHRGASAYYPENTMAAFKGAVEMKAEMIELDVMLSKDGVPVVFHDAKLQHHTNGKGFLKDFTLDELRELDAGSWFDQKFTGEKIPTLKEVLAFTAGKVALNIEIKPEVVSDRLRGGIEEKCLKLVRKYGMDKHVLFSSFDYRAVVHLKELAPEIPAAILYEKRQSGNFLPSELVKKYNADAFNCSYRQLTKKRLQDLKVNDIPFFVYTVDQPARMKSLIEKGAAGIFTNKPDVLRSVINNWNQDRQKKNH